MITKWDLAIILAGLTSVAFVALFVFAAAICMLVDWLRG